MSFSIGYRDFTIQGVSNFEPVPVLIEAQAVLVNPTVAEVQHTHAQLRQAVMQTTVEQLNNPALQQTTINTFVDKVFKNRTDYNDLYKSESLADRRSKVIIDRGTLEIWLARTVICLVADYAYQSLPSYVTFGAPLAYAAFKCFV